MRLIYVTVALIAGILLLHVPCSTIDRRVRLRATVSAVIETCQVWSTALSAAVLKRHTESTLNE